MAKYKTFDEYIKGEKIIRYLDCFKRCWNFATEAAVEKFTAHNNARDEILRVLERTYGEIQAGKGVRVVSLCDEICAKLPPVA